MLSSLRIVLILWCWFGLSQAQADFSITELRPTYRAILAPCLQDTNKFKEDSYYSIYLDSLSSTLQAASFSSITISQLFDGKGVSPKLNQFLQGETTYAALSACFKNDESEHFAFIRNLLLADSAGKLVGISMATVTFRFFTFTSLRAYKWIYSISPLLAKRALYSSVLVSSGYAFYNLKKEIYPKSTNTNELEKIKTLPEKWKIESQLHIKEIKTLLQNPELDSNQRKLLETELHNWLIVSGS